MVGGDRFDVCLSCKRVDCPWLEDGVSIEQVPPWLTAWPCQASTNLQKPGWLERQLQAARRDVEGWPQWMQALRN